MNNDIKIYSLGGLDENGKCLYVVDIDNQIYVFDCGVRYPEESLLGIDIVLPNYQYLIENRHRIKAFILSHGHDENIGALPYVLEKLEGTEVDVYGTKFTLLQLKLGAKRCEKSIDNARLHVVGANSDFKINGYTFHAFSVTHGVPDAIGFSMETSQGQIVYSGDFIFDFSEQAPYSTNFSRMLEIATKPTLLLMAESYNATYNGFICPNHRMKERLDRIFDEVHGRVFISIYGQTTYQIKEIIEACKVSHRKIYVYTRHGKEQINILKHEFPSFDLPDAYITNSIFDKNCVVLISELGNKVFKKLKEIAINNNGSMSLKVSSEDAFVIASGPHTGTEQAFAKILDDLYKTNAQVINITKDIVSMHAGSEDLKTLISVFKPKYYMPVRGYHLKLVENAKIALTCGYTHNNVIVVDNSMVVNIQNGNLLPKFDKIGSDEILIDGKGVGDVGNVVINDRRKLSSDGVIIVSCAFDITKRKIEIGPKLNLCGFEFPMSLPESEQKVKEIISDIILECIKKPGMIDFADMRTKIRDNVSVYLRKELGKDPMVLPAVFSL